MRWLAALSVASALDLSADDATVLHNSNKLALRLLPCDVFARVAPVGHEHARFEVELAQRLAETESPVAALEPRVEPRGYERDGFEVTLWTYYEPATPRSHQPPTPTRSSGCTPACASSMSRRHTSRIESPSAEQLVTSRDLTPELTDADREMLASTLRRLRRVIRDRGACRAAASRRAAPGQRAQHEERTAVHRPRDVLPRAGRVRSRPCPRDVSEHYPGVDQDLLRDCRHPRSRDGRHMALGAGRTNSRTGATWAQSGSAKSEQRSNAELNPRLIPEYRDLVGRCSWTLNQ